ncbi:MAG TPA: hypothetical protein VLK89_03730 [Solirubrobacterales bacterium]|nr:hypothetical protein [Solirubrobacterales bacterium]
MARVKSGRGSAEPAAIVISLICALLLLPAPAWAGPADLDATFGEGGFIDLARAPTERFPGLFAYAVDMAPGPDETVLVLSVANECSPVGCRYPMIVTRYGADGSLDRSYGDRGSAMPALVGNGEARLAVDSQGRASIAVKEGVAVHVVRLAADGSPDHSFGSRGEAVAPGARNSLIDLAVAADDKIVVESDWYIQHPGNRNGHLKDAGKATTAVSVTRFLPDGRPDPSFGGTGTVKASFRRASPPTAMAVRPGRGGVLLAGRTCCSPHPVPYLVRILAGGRVDRGFAHLPGLRRLRRSQGVFVNALMLGRGGEVDLAGSVEWGRYEADRRGFLLRLRADGMPDRRFGRGGTRLPGLPIDAAATDPRNRTFAVSEDASSGDLVVFRLKSGGALDRSFSGRKGALVRGAGGGEGGVVAAYSGSHPLLFNQRIFTCRSTCPPAPVLVRFVG